MGTHRLETVTALWRSLAICRRFGCVCHCEDLIRAGFPHEIFAGPFIGHTLHRCFRGLYSFGMSDAHWIVGYLTLENVERRHVLSPSSSNWGFALRYRTI